MLAPLALLELRVTGYDPLAHGARCHSCYLKLRREGGPVPAEHHRGATCTIVAEAPGRTECEVGRPLVGESGQELMRALSVIGVSRADISLTNVLLCRPPGNALDRLLYDWRAENKRRRRDGRAEYPHPFDCCLPRLLEDLAPYENFIALGGPAVRTITMKDDAPMALRGGPIEGLLAPSIAACIEEHPEGGDRLHPHFALDKAFAVPGARPVKVLPTVHPSFVLHAQKWRRVFRGDIARAFRWFRGILGWTDPKVYLQPTPEQVRYLLGMRERFFAYDVETTQEDALVAALFCIGIGTPEWAMVLPFQSREDYLAREHFPYPGFGKFYTSGQYAEIVEELRRFFTDRKKIKIGHNAGLFDRNVIEHHLGVTPRPLQDTLIWHKGVESEMPHNLAFVGTTYTDVTAWKADKSGTEAETDRELHLYNATDVVVTARVMPALETAVVMREQLEVVKKDHRLQELAHGMHLVGVLVDPKERDNFNEILTHDIVKFTQVAQKACGRPDFNPNAPLQVADVLFNEWGFAPVKFSEKTGEPSTDDDSLRNIRVNYQLTPEQRAFIDAQRKVRLAVKLRGTDVLKLYRRGEPYPDDFLWEDVEEDEEDRRKRKDRDAKKSGVLLDDGRVHASYNVLPTSGRFNCSDPNMQNKKKWLRTMFIAQPFCLYCKEPHALVAADMDQLEMRCAANRWGLANYRRALLSGSDPHAETAKSVFGEAAVRALAAAEKWAKANGKKPKEYPDWQRMRDFAKIFYYACQFGAQDKTVHEIISAVEDEKGNLVYADVSRTDTANRRAALLRNNPEFEAAWAALLARFRAQGHLLSGLWKRRRDFLNGEEPNEIYNFDIQPLGAEVVHEATFELVKEIPFQKWCPGTGLVIQGHDQLVFEVPESKAAWTKELLVHHMTRRYEGHPVPYTCEPKVGKTWKSVC